VTRELIEVGTLAFITPVPKQNPTQTNNPNTTINPPFDDPSNDGDRCDILFRGLWKNQHETIVDIRVTDNRHGRKCLQEASKSPPLIREMTGKSLQNGQWCQLDVFFMIFSKKRSLFWKLSGCFVNAKSPGSSLPWPTQVKISLIDIEYRSAKVGPSST
jgi:hypothetical protein